MADLPLLVKKVNNMVTPIFSARRSRLWKGVEKRLLLIALGALIIHAGCKNRSGITEISEAPEITSTDPANDAVGIPIDAPVIATFNEEMDPSTVTNNSFLLRLDTVSVSGSVSYTDSSAIFTPDERLEFRSSYTAAITSDAQNLNGDAMPDNYEWQFTTVDEPKETDADPPQITSTTPDDEETEVSINTAIIATFSEPMNGSTLNTNSFTVHQETTPISGSVTYSDNRATFSPASPLEYDNTYTATITTSAEDTAGNSLAEEYSWIFTTDDQPDNTAPQIVSTNPTDDEDDVSPSTTVTVHFNESINSSTVNESSFFLESDTQISGDLSTSESSVTFTPSDELSFETTYTATVTTGIEDLSGNNLDESYSWNFTTSDAPDTSPPTVETSSPDDGEQDVSVETAIVATFSEPVTASDPDDAFRLTSGGSSVSGSVDISGDRIIFTPSSNLDYASNFTATVTTDIRDLAGNQMESQHSWSFSTEDPPDTSPPEIVSRSPSEGAEDVSIETEVSATFSEPLDESTVSTSNFFLERDGDGIPGSVRLSGETVIFTPSDDLDYGSEYTATVTEGIEDRAGNSLENEQSWTFDTEEAPDNTPPSVTSRDPSEGATDVSIETDITIGFNEPVTASNPENAVLLEVGGSSVSGTVDISDSDITFTPSGDLEHETTYRVVVTTAVEDLAGNSLEESVEWEFTTENQPDDEPPEVTSTNPGDGETDVPVTIEEITVTFDEFINSNTLNEDTFIILESDDEIDGDVTLLSGTTGGFLPDSDLEYSTTYTAIISDEVEDLSGNSLGSDFEWSFTTEDEPDNDEDDDNGNGDEDDDDD